MDNWTMKELEECHPEWLEYIVESVGKAATAAVLDIANKGMVDQPLQATVLLEPPGQDMLRDLTWRALCASN